MPGFYVSVGGVRSAVGLIECCCGKAPRVVTGCLRMGVLREGAGHASLRERRILSPGQPRSGRSLQETRRKMTARSGLGRIAIRIPALRTVYPHGGHPDSRPRPRMAPRRPPAAGRHMRLDAICGAACRQTMRNCYRVSATAPFLAAAGPRRLPSNARIPTHAVPRDKLGGLREPGCHQTPC